MKLKSLFFYDTGTGWRLNNIEFEDVCLIVGKNSNGKSNTLSIIDSLGKILTQRENPTFFSEFHICFTDKDGINLNYTFKCNMDEFGYFEIIYEKIEHGNNIILLRESKDKASIYNFLDDKEETIYPPASKLVIHTNRDLKKYPFIEAISIWAEDSYGFKFGNISSDKPFNEQHYNLLTTVEEIPELFSQLDEIATKAISNELRSIGFEIENIPMLNPINSRVKYLYVQESGVIGNIPFNKLSQGLFRCLALLIFLEYLIAKKKPATVIIDDLCEGLDYERATKLGKLVFEKCLANNIQLIATSNDAFLMETVDLKYWNVLQRNGSVVTSLNAKNHPDLFRDFKFTGLSNFDFFASDYIAQKL
ncbi:MAG: ATP-binding protein [Flavobacterium sp.]|nr:ATP-binding protein [Flavobacterium sp.]